MRGTQQIKDAYRDAFNRCDANKNGTIERHELMELLIRLDPKTWDEERVSALFAVADQNRDGEISYDEFLSFLEDGPDQIAFQKQVFETGSGQEASEVVEPRQKDAGVVVSQQGSASSSKLVGLSADGDWPQLPPTGYDMGKRPSQECCLLAESPHDQKKWRAAFDAAGDGTRHADMTRIRALRRLIWLQTEKAIKCSLSGKAAQPGLPPLRLITSRTKCMLNGSKEQKPSNWREGLKEKEAVAEKERVYPKVEVVEQDMLEVAQVLAERGMRVAVLNMACSQTPGGGYASGAGAQEENFHRRSDAVRFTVEQRAGVYPIPVHSCLVSEGVTVFRGSEADGYPFLPVPFQVCMLSCAALEHPRLVRQRGGSQLCYASDKTQRDMEMKVKLITDAAVCAGCDAVVLSAFGCGAFGNPPEVVADIFKRSLAQASVEHVAFCIFNDHNAGRRHNPRGNFLPFAEVFAEFGSPSKSSAEECKAAVWQEASALPSSSVATLDRKPDANCDDCPGANLPWQP